MTRVRDLAEGDLPAWRALFRAYGVFYETAFDDAHLDHVGRLLLEPGSGVDAFVAEDDEGRVIGFAHYRAHPDTFSSGSDWYLDDLFVDPDARGHGAATALIEHLVAHARRVAPGGTIRWITAADNARAQRVYDRVATRTSWVTYELRA
ncbi:N-acetyltransferase family protein [Pseudolysinimonas sp.]|uniref:GNAT family N-acetyltransferase n=1 Tax=Pseudolysinimonas sp. TaxID=2680009 RepID=UPI003F7ED34D